MYVYEEASGTIMEDAFCRRIFKATGKRFILTARGSGFHVMYRPEFNQHAKIDLVTLPNLEAAKEYIALMSGADTSV